MEQKGQAYSENQIEKKDQTDRKNIETESGNALLEKSTVDPKAILDDPDNLTGLRKVVYEFYKNQNYNCSETMLHACNAYYHLGLDENAMKMMGGFGGGMFTGNACGALVGCVAALSRMLIENKAHEEMDVIRPAVVLLNRNFRAELGDTQCSKIKPVYNKPEYKCLLTCLMAASAMEKTVKEHGIES